MRCYGREHPCPRASIADERRSRRRARRRGLAPAVLDAIVTRARARGARRLELLVEADNARAIRFYERYGFAREGLMRGAFRRAREEHDVDEIPMALLF